MQEDTEPIRLIGNARSAVFIPADGFPIPLAVGVTCHLTAAVIFPQQLIWFHCHANRMLPSERKPDVPPRLHPHPVCLHEHRQRSMLEVSLTHSVGYGCGHACRFGGRSGTAAPFPHWSAHQHALDTRRCTLRSFVGDGDV